MIFHAGSLTARLKQRTARPSLHGLDASNTPGHGWTMRKILLRVAAFLVLFTCAGHTYGTLASIPPDQTRMIATLEQMKATMIPMPLGSPKSYSQILDGSSWSVTVYLLSTGLVLLALSRRAAAGADDAVLSISSAGLILVAGLSAVYFFPLPAICTGAAALLGFAALKAA